MALPTSLENEPWVIVKTTLPAMPLPPNSGRKVIHTARLTLKPCSQDDLAELFELRSQPEVMVWTAAGRPDKSQDESQAKLSLFIPPNDVKTFNYSIFWRETGQFIGMGGCHMFQGEFGWPEIGYMLRKEFWGRGLATEFIRAYLDSYESLPREEAELKVMKCSIPEGQGESGAKVDELLTGVVEGNNDRSFNVVRKADFEIFVHYLEPSDDGEPVVLAGVRRFVKAKA
ncbi:uncharacterized protein E0L32_003266 [Thyridium curvatum]|uniref:N-acetyltransferase domain-containing protein n=1 Tax=Thyridium curvatum TaxID=1093900 RepID=A0A507BKB3_9PEZI|nr:uncharacterized protein E0L32_003266 [Thyridium curvatum]TPX17148.1 hypothetical protein E0L32_003266 [Thyridium curvatum]